MSPNLNIRVVKPYDQYDGLITLGICEDGEQQRYLRYWIGEDDSSVSFALVPLQCGDEQAIEANQATLREFFDRRPLLTLRLPLGSANGARHLDYDAAQYDWVDAIAEDCKPPAGLRLSDYVEDAVA